MLGSLYAVVCDELDSDERATLYAALRARYRALELGGDIPEAGVLLGAMCKLFGLAAVEGL